MSCQLLSLLTLLSLVYCPICHYVEDKLKLREYLLILEKRMEIGNSIFCPVAKINFSLNVYETLTKYITTKAHTTCYKEIIIINRNMTDHI